MDDEYLEGDGDDESPTEHARVWALTLSRMLGCNCDVKIEINDVLAGVLAVNIHHEDECRLLYKAKAVSN